MGGDDGPIADGGMVADADLVGEHPVEDDLMADIHAFANLHTAPTMHGGTPRLYRGDEDQLVEEEPPQELDGIPNPAEEAIQAIKLQDFLCGHSYVVFLL